MVAIWPSGSLRFFQTSSPLAMENPPFWISQQATGLTFHTEDATRPTTKAKLEPITLKWEHHGDIHCGYIYIWYTEFYYIWIYIIFNIIYTYIYIYSYIYIHSFEWGDDQDFLAVLCRHGGGLHPIDGHFTLETYDDSPVETESLPFASSKH